MQTQPTLSNAQLAQVLFELADLLEIDRAPAYTLRAFRNAGRAIESLAEPAAALLERGTLTDVPGIGQGVARRVGELLQTGELAQLVELRKKFPRGLAEMMHIDGLGPKGAEQVHAALGIGTLDELEAAAKEGRLRGLPRFGERKEARVLAGIESYRKNARRLTLTKAWPVAEQLLAQVAALPGVVRAELCGSLRRRKETLGDLDVLVEASDEHALAITHAFVTLPGVREVLGEGPTRASVKLHDGLQADLRVVPPASWGAALHYFTGSKEHNIEMRRRALERGWKLSEYGVFDADGRSLGGREEAEVFALLGLPEIPPELREGRGELEAALAGTLPKLLEPGELRGDLHSHTSETDGKSTLEEMVAGAAAIGLEYLAITDHSQALSFANGLTPERLRLQGRQIAALNDRYGGKPRILRGIEADILADGSVDLGPEVLRELDWVVGSVHSLFRLSKQEQTERVVRAIESGLIDVLGHPTGRLLGEREPYEIDLQAVFEAARRTGTAVELNAFPQRLDLNDENLRLAKQAGVSIVLSTDSHAVKHLGQTRHGVFTARRGWLTAADVVNTLPVHELLARFAHHHQR